MRQKRKFTATFSDGTMLRRGSMSKEYTHCWRVWIDGDGPNVHPELRKPGRRVVGEGWASDFNLASKAARTAQNHYWRCNPVIEIVDVVVSA